ncbi:MAG TPA: CBS domain-containing protein [Kofleriaceae bacterium]|jgi:CBS domain-containing protein|nr:CBS domain-containing protein [Kofleriaceae bacterium]
MPDPTIASSQPVQRIFRDRSSHTERPLACAELDDLPRVPTIADLISVTDIMTRAIVCARRELPTDAVLELMLQHRLGCLPVIEDPGRPIGMITRVDLVEQLLGPGARPMTANELMLPLAITLGERATVAHAAALMAAEGVHHVPIVDGFGRMIGIVSSLDIVRWLAANDGFGSAVGH